jgi:hypothetical protein
MAVLLGMAAMLAAAAGTSTTAAESAGALAAAAPACTDTPGWNNRCADKGCSPGQFPSGLLNQGVPWGSHMTPCHSTEDPLDPLQIGIVP